jgi:hypothetical protein
LSSQLVSFTFQRRATEMRDKNVGNYIIEI